MNRISFLTFLCATASLTSARGANSYSFVTVDNPATPDLYMQGINDLGQSAGYWAESHAAVRSSDGTISTFDLIGCGRTLPTGINNSGAIAGICTPVGNPYYAQIFLRKSDSTYQVFQVPGADSGSSHANGISGSGAIAGNYQSGGLNRGFVLAADATTFTTILYPGAAHTYGFGVNDSGQIAGVFRMGGLLGPDQGFLYTAGTFSTISVPGADSTDVFAINNRGTVVGVYNLGGIQRGFLRAQNGSIIPIDVPGATHTIVRGVNDEESLTGWYWDAAGVRHSFVALAQPLYRLVLLYDQTRSVKRGATIPIKVQLLDSLGANVSSPSISLTATTVRMTSSVSSELVQDSGNSNPDSMFRLDANVGGTGGYIFNLSTDGLATGSYAMSFKVTGDPVTYFAPFQVR